MDETQAWGQGLGRFIVCNALVADVEIDFADETPGRDAEAEHLR